VGVAGVVGAKVVVTIWLPVCLLDGDLVGVVALSGFREGIGARDTGLTLPVLGKYDVRKEGSPVGCSVTGDTVGGSATGDPVGCTVTGDAVG
jgi:hypothetical protein